jgi:DNA-binding NarL/FixJ family response regulator
MEKMETNQQGQFMREVWMQLMEGQLVVDSVQTNQDHQRLVLKADRQRTHLKVFQAQMLARILRGESQKVLAAETAYSISSIAGAATSCLQTIGFTCASHDAPVSAVVLAHAHADPSLSYLTDCFVESWSTAILLYFPRIHEPPEVGLSPSEQDVLGLLLDGLSHYAIALRRATSLRTIANQLSSIYSKLRVSGRLSVLRKLLAAHPPQLETSAHGIVPVDNGSPQLRPVGTRISRRARPTYQHPVNHL